VVEEIFTRGRKGPEVRPFSQSAEVRPRGYSQPMQRAITDFGADGTFVEVSQKMKEHYGIEVPVSTARQITEGHGGALLKSQQLQTEIPPRPGVACIIAEMDGSMIPIVETPEPADRCPSLDRRKNRQLGWQEARLCLARRPGSVTPRLGATLGGPEAAGEQLADCVIRAGAGCQTQIHGVGDGASWIVTQMERRFGTQVRYLIDFSHLGDYLAAAAEACAPDHPITWLEQQKMRLRQNHSEAVLDELAPFLERDKLKQAEAPVQACYRYIDNRPGQFDYAGALAADLPIGSGEIESAHRYVIQDRLKIAGAWWKKENAAKMLALRVLRANGDWQSYWQNSYSKAA
jgi:hypothetical protein